MILNQIIQYMDSKCKCKSSKMYRYQCDAIVNFASTESIKNSTIRKLDLIHCHR